MQQPGGAASIEQPYVHLAHTHLSFLFNLGRSLFCRDRERALKRKGDAPAKEKDGLTALQRKERCAARTALHLLAVLCAVGSVTQHLCFLCASSAVGEGHFAFG